MRWDKHRFQVNNSVQERDNFYRPYQAGGHCSKWKNGEILQSTQGTQQTPQKQINRQTNKPMPQKGGQASPKAKLQAAVDLP